LVKYRQHNIPLSRREFLKLGSLAAGALLLDLYPVDAAWAAPSRWFVKGINVPQLQPFDDLMFQFMSLHRIPNGTLAVSKDNRLIMAHGYSFAPSVKKAIGPTALFRIASISKPLTSAAVGLLLQDGLITLDTPIHDIAPFQPLPGQMMDSRLASVTIRQLLQHRGGWDRGASGSFDPMFHDFDIARALHKQRPINSRDIVRYMSGHPLDFDPGTSYAYCNFGFMLLEQLFPALTGMTYSQYVRTRLLAPLNITRMRLGRTAKSKRAQGEVEYYSRWRATTVIKNSSQVVAHPYGAWNLENMKAHGGWLASPVDLLRFAAEFGGPGSSQILAPETIAEFFNLPPGTTAPDGYWYGCGWSVRDAGAGLNTWHFGWLPGSYGGLIRRFDGLSWAFLFNRTHDSSGPDTYDEIDYQMHVAAGQVAEWPEHDLFPLYGTEVS
jgi:CubicO group peptidase (beta-lactamase class C family)